MTDPRPLLTGELYIRDDLVIEYGGNRQSGGIVPARRTDSLFLFTDPRKSERNGYAYDGFSSDGTALYYTGAGRTGDQELARGNKAIVDFSERGRPIHAFVAVGTRPGTQTREHSYIGQFILDPEDGYRRMPSVGQDRASRTVIVFRLLPVSDVSAAVRARVGVTSALTTSPQSREVPVELNSTQFFETPGNSGGTSVRRESNLVDEFVSFKRGHDFSRWAITLPAERAPLLTDVYDGTDRVLYEAKAISKRNEVRMAVGQLLDYRRHVNVDGLACSVLLPERPNADLRDLLRETGLGLTFRENGGFVTDTARETANGAAQRQQLAPTL